MDPLKKKFERFTFFCAPKVFLRENHSLSKLIWTWWSSDRCEDETHLKMSHLMNQLIVKTRNMIFSYLSEKQMEDYLLSSCLTFSRQKKCSVKLGLYKFWWQGVWYINLLKKSLKFWLNINKNLLKNNSWDSMNNKNSICFPFKKV